MRRMVSLTDELDANETGFTLPSGISDTNLSADRTNCLNGVPGYDSSTASSYLAGSRLSYDKIASRFLFVIYLQDHPHANLPFTAVLYVAAV